MADVKYFADLIPLSPASTTDDPKIMAIQSDPVVPTGGFKSTLLQFKDYVNSGKAGGKLIYGGTSTGETLELRNNSIDNLGFTIESDGVLRSNVTNYETLVINDDDIPNKKYVDDAIVVEDLWNRVGTQLQPSNSGDTVRADGGLTVGDGTAAISVGMTFDTLNTAGDIKFFDIGEYFQFVVGSRILYLDLSSSETVYRSSVNAHTFTNPNTDTATTLKVTGNGNANGIVQLQYGGDTNANSLLTQTTNALNMTFGSSTLLFDIAGNTKISSGTFALASGTDVNEISQVVDASSTNDQLCTAKAAYDAAGSVVAQQEILPVTTPGQTVFTLSQTPSGDDSLGIFRNGVKQPTTAYSFVGTTLTWGGTPALQTTDLFEAWYDWQAPSIGSLDQEQIYYVGKSGADTNIGRSIEEPFLTIGAAITAVNAQTPSLTNRFRIEVIGSGIYLSDASLTIPVYTYLHAPEAKIVSSITMLANSSFCFAEHEIRSTETAITIDGSGNRYIKGRYVRPNVNGTYIFTANGSTTHLDIDDLNVNATGTKVYSANTGSVIYLKTNKFKENVSSYNDGSASVFENILDKGTNADTSIVNQTGDIIIKASSGASKDIAIDATGQVGLKVGGLDVLTTTTIYPQWPNLPLFRAKVTTQNTAATGDGTTHVVDFGATDFDQRNNFNTTTNQFTAPIAGKYIFIAKMIISGLTSSHTRGLLEVSTPSETYALFELNTANLRTSGDGMQWTGHSSIFNMANGDTAVLRLTVFNGTKVVDIQTLTYFEGYLLTAT